MAIYTVYATLADLAEYLAIDIEELGVLEERMLKRASELVYQRTKYNLDMQNVNHAEAVKLATVAQVEEWMYVIPEYATMSNAVESATLGNFSYKLNNAINMNKRLAQRSSEYLNEQGLLYRGVRLNDTREFIDSDLHN